MKSGAAAAATWDTFRGDEARRRRGRDVRYSAATNRDAAAESWIFCGGRRGCGRETGARCLRYQAARYLSIDKRMNRAAPARKYIRGPKSAYYFPRSGNKIRVGMRMNAVVFRYYALAEIKENIVVLRPRLPLSDFQKASWPVDVAQARLDPS